MKASELSKEILSIHKELSDIKSESASRRPIEEIVKYLLYFWLTLSVVLGLLGWKQISDMSSAISGEVSKQFPRDSEQFRKYETLISDTKRLASDFEQLTRRYKERVDDLRYADVVASDFDLEGQIEFIMRESMNDKNSADPKWRAKSISLLTKLKTALATKYFPADFVFNAAQICRRLQQFQLAEELTVAAFSKDPTPPIRALMLSSLASNKVGQERIRAFSELMEMVTKLDIQHSPEIVLAEAWNAAESTRNYAPLLESIEAFLSKNNRSPPSYVFLIHAQSLLRRSQENDLERAKMSLEKARDIFVLESPMSQWNSAFLRNYAELHAAISSDRKFTLDQLKETLGGSRDVTNALNALRSMLDKMKEEENSE